MPASPVVSTAARRVSGRPRGLVSGVLILAATGCVQPPGVPTRDEVLPLVVIEIANTATQSDDYIGTDSSTPARIRIVNPDTILLDVPVTLKNVDFQAGPDLLFAASGVPNQPSLDLTLPEDGSWVPFVTRGAATSARDKDAIIEVLEARPDGIVLARKSLMVGGGGVSGPGVQIRIEGTSTVDDYVAWRPIRAQARLATAAGADVAVRVRNMTPVTAGQLLFGDVPEVTSSAVPAPTMLGQLDLTLPAAGDWVSFYVAGDYDLPSTNDKDAVLELIRLSDNAVLGREGMMVRVRKNANTLSDDERDRFLQAVARLNMTLGNYVTHQDIHALAVSIGGLAHGSEAFLPWHRAFIVRLERELQALDPGVALHYWRFDEAAPNVFSPDFLGGSGTGFTTTFATGHPFSTWTIEGASGISRDPEFAPTASPTSVSLAGCPTVATETSAMALGSNFSQFDGVEQIYHNGAHVLGGGLNFDCSTSTVAGWLASTSLAVRDPLFFLLHSNVDRIWAKWQFVEDRDDPTAVASYSPQGAYPDAVGERLGTHAEDMMWPWDERTGVVIPGEPLTTRPSTAPGGPLPVPIGPWSQRTRPRPADVIDYDAWTLLGVSGLGYGYDDVPFHP